MPLLNPYGEGHLSLPIHKVSWGNTTAFHNMEGLTVEPSLFTISKSQHTGILGYTETIIMNVWIYEIYNVN